MTANPLTDQILANVSSNGIRLSQHQLDDVNTFAQLMHDGLPDVGDAVIGQVLLHAADLYATFATSNHRNPITTEAHIAVQVLGGAGQRLYLSGDRP